MFCDSVGRDALVIKDNEWSVSTGNWDVECIGPRITIRSGPGDIVLVLKLNPPHGIIVERIDMLFEGVRFRGNDQTLEMCMDGIHWHRWFGCSVSHCHVGISIENGPRAANDPCWNVA